MEFFLEKAICESCTNVQLCWVHKTVRQKGLGTNAHRCCVQVVQKNQLDSTPANPRNCATAQKLPRWEKKVVCDRTLMKHL